MTTLRATALWAVLLILTRPAYGGDTAPAIAVKVTSPDETTQADVFAVSGKNRVGVDATQAGSWSFTGTVAQGVQGISTSPWYVNLRSAGGTELATAGAPLRVDPTGTTTQPISAAALPLPAGAATSAKQPALGTAGSPSADVLTVQGVTSMTPLKTDGSGVTQPISGTITANAGTGTFAISASSLPLPTGAATSALQTTGNASIASIDTKTPALVSGRVPVDGSGVTQPISGTVTANEGGAPWTVTGTGTAGSAATGVLTVQGIASMTALKVDGSAVTQPVSAASLPLPTGAATSALQTTGNTSLGSIDTKTPALVGGRVPVDGSGVTQPISGTVSATQGTSPWVTSRNWTLSNGTDSIAAVESGTWSVRTQDGAGNALASSTTTPAGTEQALVVRNIPSGTQTVGGSITASYTDVAPATQNITAQDTGTTSLTGANSQVFYFGSPTANSAASFAISSIGTVNVQASLIGAGGTMVIEVSTDGGTFWFRPSAFQHGTQSYTDSYTAPFSATLGVAGMTNIRVRAVSTFTSSTATITVKESLNARSVIVGEALPPGANTIGAVTEAGTWTVAQGAAAAMASAWPVKTTDGTNVAAVKAASTAAVATDPAAVVTLSPNGDQATAANQATEITSLQILDNVPSSMNGAFVQGNPAMGQLDDTSTTAATEDNVAPVRITAQRALHSNLRNAAGAEIGTAASPVFVNMVDDTNPSYSASFTAVASAATATDLACILGSASKTVRVTRIEVSGTMTLSAAVSVQLIKRSAANTGGTSASLTLVPLDSTNAAATASAVSYTANATALGASVGTVRSTRYNVPTAGGVVSAPVVWDFGDRPAQAVILRGVAQELCINLSSTTLGGSSLSGSFEFTEE